MGMLDHVSHYFSVSAPRKKRKPIQTVELKVKMDCEGCERRVRTAVKNMKGAQTVDVNRKEHRVSVTGYVSEKKVIREVQKTGKRAEKWPYIEENLVAYPYAMGAYDKKAPAGFVKDVDQAHANPDDPNEHLVSLFSDENAEGCSIM